MLPKIGTTEYHEYIQHQYVNNDRSTYDLADELSTYPNRIKRDLIKMGVRIKTRSEAQKESLASGRRIHPTKGKVRDEETKLKISASLATVYENMSKEDMAKKVAIAKDRWEKRPLEQKLVMQQKAGAGLRAAAEHGSKLEQEVAAYLAGKGIRVEQHRENLIPDDKLHVDLYLPEYNTAIEIDGPTHFLPIWGEEKLKKTMQADAKKTGLLISKNIKIIRVKLLKKNISNNRTLEVCEEIVRLIDLKRRTKFIEIEV